MRVMRRLGKKIIIRRADVDDFSRGLPTGSLEKSNQSGAAEN